MEPFAGSAALFFSSTPKAGVLADLNGHLINAMRQVRDRPKLVHTSLSALDRSAETFYRCRERFNELEPRGIEPAVLFIYLNRNCFNGLWRTNQSGKFNVPYGGEKMANTPPYDLFKSCSEALQKAKLRHQDFRRTIASANYETFIFADPPYFTATERTFIEYGQKSFGSQDLSDLIEALVQASERGAAVALTYHGEARLDGIPDEWTRMHFDVTRNVGGFKGYRKKQGEILYLSQPFRGMHQ